MKTVMENLEPQSLWQHFEALSAIPRASEKEAAARNYVLAQAARLGLESTTDGVGNVVIRKPARPGREGAAMAVPSCPSSRPTTTKRSSGSNLHAIARASIKISRPFSG